MFLKRFVAIDLNKKQLPTFLLLILNFLEDKTVEWKKTTQIFVIISIKVSSAEFQSLAGHFRLKSGVSILFFPEN